MKKHKPPYDLQRERGKFTTNRDLPINSPAIGLRMTQPMYDELESVAGAKKTDWIRQAIALALELEGLDLPGIPDSQKLEWIQEAIALRLATVKRPTSR